MDKPVGLHFEGHVRIEKRPAGGDLSDGVDQGLGRNLFQDIALGAEADRGQHRALIAEGGQEQDSGVGASGPDLAAGLDPIAIREADVHQYHIRFQVQGFGHGGRLRGRLADEPDVRSQAEDRPQADPDDLVVIDQQQPNRLCVARLPDDSVVSWAHGRFPWGYPPRSGFPGVVSSTG